MSGWILVKEKAWDGDSCRFFVAGEAVAHPGKYRVKRDGIPAGILFQRVGDDLQAFLAEGMTVELFSQEDGEHELYGRMKGITYDDQVASGKIELLKGLVEIIPE